MSKPPRSESGVPITDELAEQIADEAEAGYEIAREALEQYVR